MSWLTSGLLLWALIATTWAAAASVAARVNSAAYHALHDYTATGRRRDRFDDERRQR